MSAAPTRRSSASTRSRARAASPTCCRPTTASTCRATCRSNSRKEIQAITDAEGKELSSKRIYERFREVYVDQPNGRLKFLDHQTYPDTAVKGRRIVEATILDRGKELIIKGGGNGPIDGFVDALSIYLGTGLSVRDYSEHSIQHGSNAAAICYMEMEHPGGVMFGAGINTNIVAASLEAVVSAANRILESEIAEGWRSAALVPSATAQVGAANPRRLRLLPKKAYVSGLLTTLAGLERDD